MTTTEEEMGGGDGAGPTPVTGLSYVSHDLSGYLLKSADS